MQVANEANLKFATKINQKKEIEESNENKNQVTLEKIDGLKIEDL